jgi:hypothetical protein
VTIEGDRPHLLRDRFRQERSLATEALAIVCLSGPAAEQLFFGPDGGDEIDQQMARRYLRACFADSEIEFQMLRMRYGAERLVASEQTKIEIVADALLRLGTLSGDEVAELLVPRHRKPVVFILNTTNK